MQTTKHRLSEYFAELEAVKRRGLDKYPELPPLDVRSDLPRLDWLAPVAWVGAALVGFGFWGAFAVVIVRMLK